MLNRSEKLELVALLEEKQRRETMRRFYTYYPETGPLRRELYPKHMQFFAAGKIHRERAAMAANRVGKTEGIGAYEVTAHLTGDYPDWWPGRRFEKPINALCGGDTGTTTRDILVRKMLGPPEARGTGMVPGEMIKKIAPYAGIPGGVDYAIISGVNGDSFLQFRSYDQGREAWQGTERDVGWCDEEPPEPIYTELLLRTMTTNGIILATFTPLMGLTDVALSFLPELAPQ